MSSHGHGGRPAEPGAPEPSFGEQARTLVHLAHSGTLGTLSRRHPGHPFVSVMPYAPDERGRPLVLISGLAMHTQNLDTDPRAAREAYLARHPNAVHWVDYGDFAFWRLDLTDVYFVGGFGAMDWLTVEGYESARPDPLADAAPGIIEHMNRDHADALILYAQVLGPVAADAAELVAVDRLGFKLRVRAGDGLEGCRIGFPREVTDAGQCRRVLIEMLEDCRKRVRSG